MNARTPGYRKLLAAAIGATILATACVAPSQAPDGAADARMRLTRLQSDPQLANRASVEIRDAELAVVAAEAPQRDRALSTHLVVMADRKIDIAGARAQARLYEDERAALGEQSANVRLDARTREADAANLDASIARADAAEATSAASLERSNAVMARMDADSAREEADDLQRQVTELNARETERGLVVTLGDVLFETGRSELKGGVVGDLDKLAVFLNRYGDRTVSIEGHTDNVGGEESNYSLSRQRAESVKSYLLAQGVSSARVAASGKGEGAPVSDNESDTGRQQNRRVEVVISNEVVSSR
jgi:outer membrane protein OmpA-like peptidoglycan-associated protein